MNTMNIEALDNIISEIEDTLASANAGIQVVGNTSNSYTFKFADGPLAKGELEVVHIDDVYESYYIEGDERYFQGTAFSEDLPFVSSCELDYFIAVATMVDEAVREYEIEF